MTTQQEIFQQFATEGSLTAEQAAQLLELAEQGDTGTASSGEPEQGSATPVAAPVTDAAQAGETATNEEVKSSTDAPQAQPEDPNNSVVLAKDGKHTISYDTLVKAREGEKHWKAQATAAQQELEALKAAAQQRSDAGIAPTATDKNVAAANAAIEAGADPELFGDFSEEALAKGIQSLVDKRLEAVLKEQLEARIAAAVTPLQQKQEASAMEAHLRTIYEKHPDADSIMESKELTDWIAAQPKYAQPGIQAVIDNGSAADIVDLLDSFKAAGKSPAAAQAPATDPKAAAQAALAKAQAPVPASLSDIPGGAAGPASREAALAQMNPIDMADAMASMSPEQIETFLNRLA